MKEIYMDRVKIALNSKGPVNSSRKRFGKIAFTLTLVLLSFANSFSQCTWYTANTACTSNAPTVVGTSVSCTPPNNNGGRRNFVINNMTAGCTYRISNCGSGFDTQMTLRNAAGTVVGYNDDNGPACSGSASSIDFLCPATGQYWIQMNRYSCSTTNALNGTITVTLQGCCSPGGNPATYGTNAWIGYVYNSASAGAFTTYQGFVTEATTFNRTHSTASGATVAHCSGNQDLFAIRYRNTTNFAAGYYTFTVGGDDGVRFSIDGGSSWLINQWVDQGYTTTSNSTPVYLSGNTNMVFEYYENGGGSQSSFSYTFTPACSGTPTPGSTVTSAASVLTGGTVNLSLQNATTPATYQWQSSSSSTGPWTNISGATNSTYTATVSATTWYQCVVTCTTSSTSAASTPVQVTATVCTPAPTSVDGTGITNVTFGVGPIVNNTTSTEVGNYGNYSSQVGAVYQGAAANVSITYSTGFTYGTKIWIDWNNDLVFTDATELMYTGLSASANPTTLIASLNIPTTAALGNYRIRIGGTDTDAGPSSACYNGTWGSFEDYTISIIALPACAGTPSPGNTITSSAIVLSGSTVNLSLTTPPSGTGLSYQWQSATTSAGPWSNIGGATAATYVATVTANTWYQCIVTCSGSNGTSTPVQVTLITPPVNDACANATDLPCGTSSLAGTTVNAVSETAPLGYSSPYGVWYSFVGDGQSTTISSIAVFDHEMTIMTGSSCGSYAIVSSQDNALSNGTETYTFTSVAGTQYYVYLAHWSTTNTTTGTFTISRSCLAPLANDNCSNAEAISIQCPASATVISGNTAAATEEASIVDPVCDPGTIKDVWYVFNSGVNTSVNLTVTLGTATWLGGQLFTTCGVEATGVAVGGNVGNCDYYLINPSPTVISGLLPNTEYRLRLFTNVDWDIAGTFTFTLTTNVPTVNISTASSTICQGNQVALSGAVVANSAWTVNLSNGQSASGTGSANWSVTATPSSTTTYTVSSLSGPQCTAVISGSSTITLPTAGSALAQDNESATCTVNQNGWVHFYHSSGRLIASVNSQGQNLGAVTATSYVEGAPVSVDACTSSNPIYSTTVLGRHWVITPTNQPTSAVYVRLPYENTEFSDLTSAASTNANTNDDLLSPTDLGLSKYSNGTNANVNDVATDNCGVGTTTFHTPLGNGASTVYSSVNASYSDFSIPGFSEFWLHGSAQSSPLPVELLSFQANCQEEGKVNVTWTTASEHNSANFTVEKSRDGMNWTVLAALAGAGNSNQLINYSTIDKNPAGGVNYYRLTQIDFDGASETFNIASANCGDNSSLTTVKVYPNPSAGDFYIDFTSEEIIGSSVITIADARGMEVYSMNIEVEKGNNVFLIENLEVAPGMYYIKVSNGALTSSIVKHSLR